MTKILNGGINRRTMLKGTAATAAAVAAPAIISRSALASSGELNILIWSDELPQAVQDSFMAETGIKLNFTGFGSNEEQINKLKATGGGGFDLCAPTANRAPQFKDLGVLQTIDAKRVPIDRLNPAMAKVGDSEWNFDGKGAQWVAHLWGTEGIAWRTDQWTPAGTFPSYGDVWSDANAGKTMGRGHSMMLGAGLYMETTGDLAPGSVWAAYQSEDKMRAAWEKITAWCVARKKNIKIIWNDADTQKNGILNDGVIVGQTWDGPMLALKSAGEPVMYRAPKEGSMAWIDGLALTAGAKNIDQAYALIEYVLRQDVAGKGIDGHGYNSVVLGADKFAGEAYAKNFGDAYPEDALARLNPWPAEAPWYADIRTEYVNKFINS